MSIIVLNDLVFEKSEEGKVINKEISLFYLLLNFASLVGSSTYLYIYHKIPYYQNNSNSLTLILTRVNLLSNISYVLFFSELFFTDPVYLTTMMKILTMINPLIIFTFYFWCTCITHNIYVTFYNYTNNLEKRIKFYKYQLIVYLFIFYICTLFSIKFKEKQLNSESFSFIENYGINYVILFYLIGLFLIIYIIYRLYFIIIKKSQTFSLTSPNEIITKKLFQSLVTRHILFIFYFLITFVPINFMMILKYIFRLLELSNFYLSFITMTLLSLYGVFIFIIKLTDPITRHFFLSFILCNKDFIKEYEPLMRKDNRNSNMSNDDLTESKSEMDEKEILLNAYREYDKSFVTFYNHRNQMLNAPFLEKNKFTSFNLGNNYGLLFLQGEKKDIGKLTYKKLKTFSMKNIKSNKIDAKTKKLFEGNSKFMEMYYYQDDGDNNRESNNINIEINFVNNNDDNNNNKNETKRENLSKLTKSNISFSDIKEENCPVEESNIKDKNISNNPININSNSNINTHNNSSISIEKKSSNNFNNIKQRSISIIPYEFTPKKVETKLKASNAVINPRNSSTLNTGSLFQKRSNTNNDNDIGYLNRRGGKLITNVFQRSRQKSYIELNLKTHKSPKKNKVYSKKYKHFFEEEISGYESLNYHLEVNENLQRMMAISICLNKDRKYDEQNMYQQYYYSPLPWKGTNFYKETTPYIYYNEKNFPDFLKIKEDNRFTGIEFKVMEYSPFVFHHLRSMDKISINDILKSLDVKNNLDMINESKITGGRGNNSMFGSWDKKLIIKTINDDEKNLFINKMLEEYHYRMRDTKSLLSHIYGIFTIELTNKGHNNVMLQRNMNDLFIYSNVITFDLKGSSVDRQCIKNEDKKLSQKDLIQKYKNKTLKDTDLKIMDLKFELNPYDGKNLISSIYNDSLFLQKYDITDYSLLVFVNKYNKKNLEKKVGNLSIMSEVNKKYIFNFSIIDFLGTFDFGKKGEKFMKDLLKVFSSTEEKNFSVQNPQNYGNRFRKYVKQIIIYEKEENENDNFSS